VKYEIVPEFNKRWVVYPSFTIVPRTTVDHVARRAVMLEPVKSLMIDPLPALLICSRKMDGQGWHAWGLEGIGES